MYGMLISLLIELTVPKETLRFAFVHEQVSDTSCGFSTTATLLSMYWDVDITERDLLQRYRGTDDGISSSEISLSEISRILIDYGCVNKSFRMSIQELAESLASFAPVLVHYSRPDGHFVLVLAVVDGFLIVADPARGTELIPIHIFTRYWSGAVMLAVVPGKAPNRKAVDVAVSSFFLKYEALKQWAR